MSDKTEEEDPMASVGGSQTRRVSLQPAPVERQRRVSRDIVSALGRLELVRGKASEALCELKRGQSLDETDGLGALPFAERNADGDRVRQQLEEIKAELRVTKGDLAQVSYRAEVLESERRKYRQRVATLEEQLRGRHDDWDVVSSQSGGGKPAKGKLDKSPLSSGLPSPKSKRRVTSATVPDPLGLVSSAESDGGLPLLEKIREKDQVIDRIQQQLDFYASELRSKVQRENQLVEMLDASEARYHGTQKQLEKLEDQFEVLEEECVSMRTHREGVQRLAERCMSEAQHLGETSGARNQLQEQMAVRDSVMNDLVVRCAVQDEHVRTLQESFDRLLPKLGLAENGNDARCLAYRDEVSCLQRCLLRQLLKNQSLPDDRSAAHYLQQQVDGESDSGSVTSTAADQTSSS